MISQGELGFFEKILINNGYVLDFTNGTFSSFIMETIGIDIYSEIYRNKVSKKFNSDSKGNILRYIIRNENEKEVLILLNELILYCEDNYSIAIDDEAFPNEESISRAKEILEKYSLHEDMIHFSSSESRIIDLINDINRNIEDGKSNLAIDRLHTLTHHILRNLCNIHKIEYTTGNNSDNIQKLSKRYLDFIKENKFIDSDMSETIINMIGPLFKKFNQIRNHKSYAHDNPVLNNAESLFIFRQVVNVLKFIEDVDNEFSLKQLTSDFKD